MATNSKQEKQEIDYVAKQANLTSQIETERLAATRWWSDFGLCYIENSKIEDFTYENQIKKLKNTLNDEKYSQVKLSTTNSEYGKGKPFREIIVKKI